MLRKIAKRSLALLLILVLTISLMPITAFAEDSDKSKHLMFGSDVQMKIYQGNPRDNIVVAELKNGELIWDRSEMPDGKVLTNTDYFLRISVPKSMGGKYLSLTTGVFDDGNINGIKYQALPGKYDTGIKAGNYIPEGLGLSDVLYVEDLPDKAYGSSTYTHKNIDGTVVYKIEESNLPGADARISFDIVIQLDDLLYNNAENLFDVLNITMGEEYDEKTHKVAPLDGYECSLDLLDIKQRSDSGCAFSGSSTLPLDAKNTVDMYWRIGNTGNAQFLFETLEFDMYIPDGVKLNDVGLGSTFLKTDSSKGVISYGTVQHDSDGKAYYHVIAKNGKKSENGSYDVYFSTTVTSPTFKPGDKVQFAMKNIVANLPDSEQYSFPDFTKDFTVIDGNGDASKLNPIARDVYNDTIDTDPDNYTIQLSKCAVINEGVSDTPYDKIFEAKYNVKNADAEITSIIIPKGTNDNPQITVTGLDKDGNEVTYLIPNPNRYIFKTNNNNTVAEGPANMDYAYLIPANECGMVSIKSVKAYIGKLKKIYNYTEPWNVSLYLEANSASAFGHFTNDNAGIRVYCDYYLYNEEPTLREKKNGDLKGTSVYTSTSEKIGCFTSENLYHYYGDKAQKAIDELKTNGIISSSTKSGTKVVTNDSSDTAPSISPGSNLTLSSEISLYYVPRSTNRTNNTETEIINTTGNDNASTVQYLADPVFYLTLPADFRYEDIAFSLQENQLPSRDYKTYTKPYYPETMYTIGTWTWTTVKPLKYNIENVSYLNKTGDGRNIYKITFNDKDAGIGFFGPENKIRRIAYAVKIGTSKSSDTGRYPLSELMQLSGENPVEGAMYNSAKTSAIYTLYDKYGINDGKDINGVTKGDYDKARWGFMLQQISEVNAYNFCKVTEIDNKPVIQDWYTYNPSDPNSIALLGAKSKGQYKLVIQNTDPTYATQKLQALVPIPKKGVDMGDVFMEGPMEYNMDFTWDKDSVPDGFTIKYVKIDPIDAADLEKEIKYTDCEDNVANANAILIETDAMAANSTEEFIFDFVIGSDAKHGQRNIFFNAIRYTSFSNSLETKVGSKIAVEVATGKINGTAFYDENRNGIFERGTEKTLSGVNVKVVDGTGKFQYVTTDDDGYYEFNAVRESDVTVTFTVDDDHEYRMNVPCADLTLAKNGKSATHSYESLFSEKLDVPLDKFVTLSYNANPPEGKTSTGAIPNTKEYYKGEEAKVSPKSDNLTVLGYKFVNWNTMADGSGISYEPNITFEITEDTILYAQWEPAKYYITFDYAGGSVTKLDVETVNNLLDLNYTLRSVNKTYQDQARQILTEKAQDDPGLITIEYRQGEYLRDAMARYYGIEKPIYSNAQVNLSPPSSLYQDKGIGKNYPKDINFLLTEKNGYDARVFYDKSDGTTSASDSTSYSPWYYFYGTNSRANNINAFSTFPLDRFDTNNNLTLHLYWRVKTGFTVEYDSDGGTEFAPDKDLTWESNVDSLASAKVPTKPGYTFSHWEYEGNKIANNAEYGTLAQVDTVESITLKAVYTAKPYTVHYDSRGGSKVESRSVFFSQANMNSLVSPTYTGKVFKGWSTTGEESDIITAENTYSDLVSGNANTEETTLYAVWADQSGYTVLFDANGGTAVSDKTGLAYYADNLLENTDTSRVGYRFVSWTYGDIVVDNTKTYESLVNDDTVMSITLTANWESVDYTIKYTNVVTPIEDKKGVHWEDNNLLPLTDPEKDGYKFTGWTYNSGEVSQDNTVESLNPETNILEMVARWERILYTVEYESNGGTYVYPLVDKTSDTKNLIPENVKKDGYNLDGWFTESGQKITASTTIGSIVAPGETKVKLYAHWSQKTDYLVKYNLGGGLTLDGKETIPDKQVGWTDNHLLPTTDIYKKGYEFKGWLKGTKNVTNSTTYSYLADNDSEKSITLVAVWEKLEETVEGKIVGATLYIDDKTGVNFYVDFGAEAIMQSDGTYTSTLNNFAAISQNMKFVMKDKDGRVQKNTSVIFDSTEVSYMDLGDGVKPLYRFTLWCYSFEMADTIEATLYNGNFAEMDKPVKYSVRKYAERIKGQEPDLDKLLEGMLTYGAYSQKYYNHNTGDLASNDLDLSSVNLDRYKLKANKGISHINNASLSLQMKRGAGFDIKLSLDTDTDDKYGIEKYVENFDEFCFNNLSEAKIESNTLIKVKKNNDLIEVDKNRPYNLLSDFQKKWAILVKYDFTVEDLAVYKWDDYFKITLKDDSGQTYSLEYCLLTYANLQQNNGDQNLVNLLKSMCLYNMKSADYFYGYE